MYFRYLLKPSHFGWIFDILFPFSRCTHRVRIHTLYVLRKCHCISKIHLEILRSEDLESTLKKKWRINMKVIVMDMDGTLLNDDKKVTEYTKSVLRDMKKRGMRIGIASGRNNRCKENS